MPTTNESALAEYFSGCRHQKQTSLWRKAITENNVEAVRIISTKTDFDVNILVSDSHPLKYAIDRGHYDLFCALISAPKIDVAYYGGPFGETALLAAARNADQRYLRKILVKGKKLKLFNVNQPNSQKLTALMLAGNAGHRANVDMLVKFPGIDLRKTNANGRTVLAIATIAAHWEICARLRKAQKLKPQQRPGLASFIRNMRRPIPKPQ